MHIHRNLSAPISLTVLALVVLVGCSGDSDKTATPVIPTPTPTLSPTLSPTAEAATGEPSAGPAAGETPIGDLNSQLCAQFPLYCVPLVGGGQGVFAENETPARRDVAEHAETGVVRGVMPDGSYFLGNPAAPIRFKVFENFACGHCRDFHNGDMQRFIEAFVMTGQAVLEIDLLAFGTQPYPTEAAYAAMCAGEQGAFWEMHAVLFERISAPLDQLVAYAEDIGLDAAALRSCVESERFAAGLEMLNLLAFDLGITGTPTVLTSNGDGNWEPVLRSYENLAIMTTAANK